MPPDPEPLVSANRIIHKMTRNLFAPLLKLTPEDYRHIRIIYRHMGGLWVKIWEGDPDQLDLLRQVIQSWGSIPGRAKLTDEVVLCLSFPEPETVMPSIKGTLSLQTWIPGWYPWDGKAV